MSEMSRFRDKVDLSLEVGRFQALSEKHRLLREEIREMRRERERERRKADAQLRTLRKVLADLEERGV